MKKFTKLFLLMITLLLSTSVIFAQDYSISRLEKQKMDNQAKKTFELEKHGPTQIVPLAPAEGRAVGDDCTDPIVITVGAVPSYSDLSQTTCGRGNNYSNTALGYYDGGEDIIYELVITQAVDIQIEMNPNGTTWTGLGLFDACPDVGAAIETVTGSSGSTVKVITQTLAIGTYYIMVDTWPSPNCIPDFDLVISAPPAPQPGDNCTIPIVVNVGALPYNYSDLSQTTCGRGNDYSNTALGYYDGGEDIIYELVLNETVEIVIAMDPKGSYYTGLGLFDACPDVGNAIEVVTGPSSTTVKTISQTLNAGIYYIMVDTWPSPTCIPDFDLTIDGVAYGSIDGHVFNGDGLTIAGATVGIEDLGLVTTSASDGFYSFDPVECGTWDIQGWKEGYNLVTYSVIVIVGPTTVQDIVLTQPGMVINPLQLNETLNPNEWLKDWLGILNTGDGPLGWTAVINYPPGDAANGSDARNVTTGKVPVFVKNTGPDKSALSEKGGKPMMPSEATRDLFECNAGSLFANSPVGNTNAYWSQNGGTFQQYQQVNGISDAWNTVTFWGVFTSGTPTTADFFIGIYADGSLPGAEIASYMVTLDPIATGEVLLGSYPIYQWIATIDSRTETDFYISCQNVGNPQMYWLDSPSGTGTGASGPGWSTHTPLALCIEGGGTPGGWLTLDAYEGTVAPMGGS
ncbi:MAG: carboxypeptidase-like regulatory domain-containing protein, partial [Bacteroidales bacterium]|nr:carboxypeptidase-like regulatory domain-containing protein [Bacteroidales bacterium]